MDMKSKKLLSHIYNYQVFTQLCQNILQGFLNTLLEKKLEN